MKDLSPVKNDRFKAFQIQRPTNKFFKFLVASSYAGKRPDSQKS